jgi:hypothetical protein
LWRTWKNTQLTVGNIADSWAGKAADRRSRLQARLFTEVEVADLLHSVSYQELIADDGGDSSGKRKYDRYAAVVPCPNWDPKREFELKSDWNEVVLELARHGNWRFHDDGKLLDGAGGFKVQVRGEAILNQRDSGNAWLEYTNHFRAAQIESPMPPWMLNEDAMFLSLTGALDGKNANSIKGEDLRGFEVTYTCGTRQVMHDLPIDNLSKQQLIDADSQQGVSFKKCVLFGVGHNAGIKAQNPTESFLANEIVVRATFSTLPSCGITVDHSKFGVNETQNSITKNFLSLNGCGSSVELTTELQKRMERSYYRGLLTGNGLGADQLMELVLDPADFVDVLGITA